jgi:hypothetical protein
MHLRLIAMMGAIPFVPVRDAFASQPTGEARNAQGTWLLEGRVPAVSEVCLTAAGRPILSSSNLSRVHALVFLLRLPL